MFSNLLQNAVKYTAEGGEISIRLTRGEEGALFVISDTGIGIPSQSLPNIFDSFFRVEHSRSDQPDAGRETGGAGLGLTIVKRIVELHNGEIHVDSKIGEGTTFTVHL
jgi:signal transduction histidine kinase